MNRKSRGSREVMLVYSSTIQQQHHHHLELAELGMTKSGVTYLDLLVIGFCRMALIETPLLSAASPTLLMMPSPSLALMRM